MEANQPAPQNIDEYIAGFPQDVQEILQNVRATIRAAAPEAEETISYKMPTFNLFGKYLVYFAGFKNHVGFYGAPKGIAEFNDELSLYEAGKGTLQFPYAKPLPIELITKIVKYRVQENQAKAGAKGKYK